ncbi:class I SAM-dependent methyltransferase [Zwartia sp.]|uniref:class I SAM-dependent methyltransferase n=1 Tax=Zwartia sp. TaxID=2978004 RepID=UPI002717E8E1|nr:class I SAM-dependent methyltransferase [Zwartia sp.]MDO9024473.1 class I SAM-dependent methyltransferase [Zwartia sp.]
MTGFSAQWLALREPADHRARDHVLQTKVVTYLEGIARQRTAPVRLVDLGSGSGSNLRALAPQLPAAQHWTLVDYDPALLAAARDTLIEWADEVIETRMHDAASTVQPIAALSINKLGKHITVDFRCEDLSENIEAVLSEPADLITAAAFFDLVAENWLKRFCHALSVPLYTVLTYDGIEKWSPPDPSDAAILKAFHHHQQTDKGFGAAAGPTAAGIMKGLLEQRDFEVLCASSPWQLNDQDRTLIEQLATGSAAAVKETGLVDADIVQAWSLKRRQAQTCEIGHIDLYAMPQSR